MGKGSQNLTPPPGKPLSFKPEDIVAIFRTNHGNVSATARVLGCARRTVLDYCERFPEVQAAKEEGVEDRIDFAEEQLQAAMADRESWAIQLALRGQGAKRGHAEKSETTISLDVSKLSDEQLADLAAGKSPLAVLAGTSGQS
ncbi:MAG TPA: hypothetical protein PLB21_09940 [Actinomycetota bacterium]|nr:hypothetical protein [Actinomycetota bacterium]